VSDVILSSALRPIEKASKSVRQIAGRLDNLEGALIAESKHLATKFGLVDVAGKEGKGGLPSARGCSRRRWRPRRSTR